MATNGDQRLSDIPGAQQRNVPALDPVKQAAHLADIPGGDDFMVRVSDVAAAARHIARRWNEFAQRLEADAAGFAAEMHKFTGKVGK